MASFLLNNNFMTVHKRKKKKPTALSSPPHPKKRGTLAVCMIVKNEEQCLPLILSDIEGLWDELIIVDTGSTDRTIEIAQNFGARVVSQPWTNDFSAARNRSKDEATAAWIMWLDADDRMETGQVRLLQSMKQTLDKNCVYAFQVTNTRPDGLVQSFLQVRLFPNDPRLHFENRIHEDISPSAKKHGFKGAQLPIQIIHTGYESPELLSLKTERNTRILEEDLSKNPGNIVLGFIHANSLASTERFQEAQLQYEKIIGTPGARQEQEDVYHGALVCLAPIYLLYNKYEEAAKLARRAVEIKPDDIQGWYQWGSALMRLNANEEALEKFSRALACKYTLSSVTVNYNALRIYCLEAMAKTLQVMSREQEAINLIQDELKRQPSPQVSALLDKLQNKQEDASEEVLLQKGQELLECQDYAETARIFLKIIKSNPQSFAAYNGLGLVSWYLGNYHDAYMLFKKAVQTGPVHEDILLNLWDAAQLTGYIDDARAVLGEILSRNPGMEKIKEFLEKKA
jgi:tetratricopeptide (TPR) repeat protein